MVQQVTASREEQRSQFDVFFDFYFPRVYGWLAARTADRAQTRQLTEVALRRAFDHYDGGEPIEHAPLVLAILRVAWERERRQAMAAEHAGSGAIAGAPAGWQGKREPNE